MTCSVLLLGALIVLQPGQPAGAPAFRFPSGLTMDPSGNLILADRGAHYVFRIDVKTGAVTVVAGTGQPGFSGDGGPAREAMLRNPEWVEFGPNGDLYLADRGNHRVRRIDAKTGVITTIAGTGVQAHSGDGGPAGKAGLTNPFGLTLDGAGHLFIFDTEAHCIRRVDAQTGVITTVIGSTARGFSGDGGPATKATLQRPHNGLFDEQGRLVFGDSFNQRIRRWDPKTGTITTIAGSGEQGSAVDGAAAAQAPFMYFGAMVYDSDGNLIFTSLDNRILMIEAATDKVRVLAGSGEFSTPYGLVRGANGDLFVADAENRRVRRIDGRTGAIHTLAGDGR